MATSISEDQAVLRFDQIITEIVEDFYNLMESHPEHFESKISALMSNSNPVDIVQRYLSGVPFLLQVACGQKVVELGRLRKLSSTEQSCIPNNVSVGGYAAFGVPKQGAVDQRACGYAGESSNPKGKKFRTDQHLNQAERARDPDKMFYQVIHKFDQTVFVIDVFRTDVVDKTFFHLVEAITANLIGSVAENRHYLAHLRTMKSHSMLKFDHKMIATNCIAAISEGKGEPTTEPEMVAIQSKQRVAGAKTRRQAKNIDTKNDFVCGICLVEESTTWLPCIGQPEDVRVCRLCADYRRQHGDYPDKGVFDQKKARLAEKATTGRYRKKSLVVVDQRSVGFMRDWLQREQE